MEVPVLQEALSRLVRSDHSHPTLMFFGGEPLLEMPLVRLAVGIVRANKPPWMHPDLRVFTNGLLLDGETARFLADEDVHITLSFDGLPAAQDRRGPGTFEILDRILVWHGRECPERFRTRLAVAITLTSENVAHLAGSVEYFVSRDVSDIDVAPLATHDPRWGAAACDELDRQLGFIAEESRRGRVAPGATPFRPFRRRGRGTSAQLCGAASRTALFVDVDGSIAPCAAMARSCLRDPPPLLRDALAELGDVHLTDPAFDAKLRDRESKARTLSILCDKTKKFSGTRRCRDCPDLGGCVVCPASIAWSGGVPDPNCIPNIQCDFNRLVERHRREVDRDLRV